MIILGIETSCDETAAAIVEDGTILHSNIIASSVDLHTKYGGVVPEIAARAQMEYILPVIEQALQQGVVSRQSSDASQKVSSKTGDERQATRDSNKSDLWDYIDAIAVTQGPGLSGSLLVGVMTARSLAIAKNKPLYAVNHIMAHTFGAFIAQTAPALADQFALPAEAPQFPLLSMTVSGGHSQIALFDNPVSYRILGQTSDDAVGEAYDKVAKMLGLPYPGGPSVDKLSISGDPLAIDLPISKLSNPYDFSFSGLKTAVLRASQALVGKDYTFPSSALPEALNESQKANIAASFQTTAVKTLINALEKAVAEYQPKSVVVAGGVAANPLLRQEAERRLPMKVVFPDIKLCTDNAAMVASLAYFLSTNNQPVADPFKLSPIPSLSM